MRWWFEEGGGAVSFGSDAHVPLRVGALFDVAVDIVAAAGFRPAPRRVRVLAPLRDRDDVAVELQQLAAAEIEMQPVQREQPLLLPLLDEGKGIEISNR